VAQLHCERGLALAVELGTFNANFFGFDNRISALVGLTRTLWLRGLPNQALGIAPRAIGEAASRDHPFPISVSLVHVSTFLPWTGDLPRASDLIEQLIAHAGRYSLAPYRALGIALKGELAISLDTILQSLQIWRNRDSSTNHAPDLHFFTEYNAPNPRTSGMLVACNGSMLRGDTSTPSEGATRRSVRRACLLGDRPVREDIHLPSSSPRHLGFGFPRCIVSEARVALSDKGCGTAVYTKV
jgi:hypothetical protein